LIIATSGETEKKRESVCVSDFDKGSEDINGIFSFVITSFN